MSKKSFFWLSILILALAPALRAQTGFNIIHPFAGAPNGGDGGTGNLVLNGSYLYGATENGGAYDYGTVFRVKIDGTGFVILHSFSGATEGSNPTGSLVLKNSLLYGLTRFGGPSGKGTIFKVDINGSGFKVLHSFAGGTADGESPEGSLTAVGTALYGGTDGGGASNMGTIFKIGLAGTGFKVIHHFSGADGAWASDTLIYSGTKLYGTTAAGGSANRGTLFRMSPTGSGFTVLHHFLGKPTDGEAPSLVKLTIANGVIYGTTYTGGLYDSGTIFKLNTSGSGYSVIHSFDGGTADGGNPYAGVIVVGTKLYGLTDRGGASSSGVLYVINTNGTGFQVLHSFAAADTSEGEPCGGLIRKVTTTLGERLYGLTTGWGTTGHRGCVFYYRVK